MNNATKRSGVRSPGGPSKKQRTTELPAEQRLYVHTYMRRGDSKSPIKMLTPTHKVDKNTKEHVIETLRKAARRLEMLFDLECLSD